MRPKYRPGISDKNLQSKLKQGIIRKDTGLQKQRMTKLRLKKAQLYFQTNIEIAIF